MWIIILFPIFSAAAMLGVDNGMGIDSLKNLNLLNYDIVWWSCSDFSKQVHRTSRDVSSCQFDQFNSTLASEAFTSRHKMAHMISISDFNQLNFILKEVVEFYSKKEIHALRRMVIFTIRIEQEEHFQQLRMSSTISGTFFENVDLDYKMYFYLKSSNAIFEAWNVKNKVLHAFHQKSDEVKEERFYKLYGSPGRMNFHQAEIIGVAQNTPNLNFNSRFDPVTKEARGGLNMENFSFIAACLNFTYFVIPDETTKEYLALSGNNTLTGVISFLETGVADVNVDFTEFLVWRLSAYNPIVFLHPDYVFRMLAFFQQPIRHKFRSVHATLLTADAWQGMLCILLLIKIAMTLLMSVRKPRAVPGKIEKFSNQVMLWEVSILSQIGWYMIPSKTSIRIAAFTGSLFGYLFYVIYSSSLIAMLANKKPPISSYNDLITQQFDIYYDEYILTAQVLLQNVKDNKGSTTVRESIYSILNSSVAVLSSFSSFYDQVPLIGLQPADSCSLISYEDTPLRTVKSSMFILPHSPFRDHFNIRILDLLNRGIGHRIKHKYHTLLVPSCIRYKESLKVDLFDILSLHLLLIGSWIFSILILSAEVANQWSQPLRN